MCLLKVLILWTGVLMCLDLAQGTFVKSLQIFYNNSQQEQHRCTALRLEEGKEEYIVAFKPEVDSKSLLHLSVQVCDDIPLHLTQWSCGSELPGCRGAIRPIYVWGQNSGNWILPDDSAIPVGGKSGGRFLVLQAHTRAQSPDEIRFQRYFKVEMELTNKRPTYEVGLMVLGNTGYIPAMTNHFVSESGCLWGSSKTALLIGYRTHTHSLGFWVSGYRFRDGNWKRIAARNPQDPEDLIPTRRVVLLHDGDVLTSRCFYHNNEPSRVYFGATSRDEMCNLHLIYIFPFGADPGLRFQTCANDAQEFHLADYFDYIPAETIPRIGSQKKR